MRYIQTDIKRIAHTDALHAISLNAFICIFLRHVIRQFVLRATFLLIADNEAGKEEDVNTLTKVVELHPESAV